MKLLSSQSHRLGSSQSIEMWQLVVANHSRWRKPDKCNQCDSTSSNTGTLRKHTGTEHLEQRERDGSWVSPINQRPPWQPAARQQLPIQTCNSTKKHTVCYNTENILNIYTPALQPFIWQNRCKLYIYTMQNEC